MIKTVEELICENLPAVERYCRYKLPNYASVDAEDVISEVLLSAYENFGQLRQPERFRAWILSIARCKCVEWYRLREKRGEVSLDEAECVVDSAESDGVCAEVEEVLESLSANESEILRLYYWEELQQSDISQKLGIPLGTVKSRLYTARESFREKYSGFRKPKGDTYMKTMPTYTITRKRGQPFSVRHEELPGMFIIPRVGEKLSYDMFDMPDGRLTGSYRLEAVGEAEIHGVRGVEIHSEYLENGTVKERSTIFAQLTDKFCRYLGGITEREGLRKFVTFFDQEFEENYKIGRNNCGFEVECSPKGIIIEQDGGLTVSFTKPQKSERRFFINIDDGDTATIRPAFAFIDGNDDIQDIVGRFDVTINGRTYDTVRLIDIEGGMLCEYYLDKNGRTVLWRRFNSDLWKNERYKKRWTELLPESERLSVNGDVFVHWYDCISDYIG